MPILKTEHLSKAFYSPEGKLSILENISLTIATGETLAILGASGSGKSTLLGLLAGFDRPTSGSVFFDDQNLADLNSTQLAQLWNRAMGFVFQSFHLLPALTAVENIMVPLQFSGIANAQELAQDALKSVGLEHRAKHYPAQLSGGEMQRTALARALVTHPKILFADEPTGNLDNRTAAHIRDLLFERAEQEKVSLVLVTHEESLAKRASKIVEINQGQLRSC